MTWSTLIAALAIALSTGCGRDSDVDAGPDAPLGPSVDGDVSDVCPEFSSPGSEIAIYPGVIDGTLAEAGADIDVEPAACAVEDAPYGVRVPGPDRVIALTGLDPGREYMVRLHSSDDLAFYVASSCSVSAGGPGAGQCLLYVDASTRGVERGRFVAPPSGSAYVVIDFFLSDDPADGEFSVDVYRTECDDASGCGGATEFCVDERCVECASSFDCPSAQSPVCDARTNDCRPPFAGCTADDASEDGNDGPAGAVDITPVGASSSVGGAICNEPGEEVDFFRFTVSASGERFTLALDWTDPEVDLDLELFDASGVRYGMSFWERPESVALTFLPAGTYYARVQRFGIASRSTTPYTLSAVRQGVAACGGVSDCAAEFDNQIFRGSCTAGACRPIDPSSGLAVGELCDSASDCASGLCTSFFFNASADSRSACTIGCGDDGDCAAVGAQFVCTDFLVDNVCVKKCSSDLHCPVVLSVPPQSGPWHRLSCNVSNGRCEL